MNSLHWPKETCSVWKRLVWAVLHISLHYWHSFTDMTIVCYHLDAFISTPLPNKQDYLLSFIIAVLANDLSWLIASEIQVFVYIVCVYYVYLLCIYKYTNIQVHLKKGYFKQKCHASEKYVDFYRLNTWLGLLLHELLHQCGVVWRQSNFPG